MSRIPRVRIIPVDPQSLALWDGRSDLSRMRHPATADSVDIDAEGVFVKGPNHPVIGNGSTTPTSYLEALMQAPPGAEALTSSEEMIELGEAIEAAMAAVLTDRERFVVEAIVFERLSLRDVAARWGDAWSKTQVARIRDAAFAKLAQVPELQGLAGVVR